MGLDQVRRLLGHSTLNTTLHYLSLVPEDLHRAHRDAAVIERLGVLRIVNRTTRARASRKPPSVKRTHRNFERVGEFSE
jgi:hypothetical protein